MRPAVLIGGAIALTLVCPRARADTVRLTVGHPLQRIELLKPSVHRYLRYFVKKDGSRTALDVWQRRISFEASGTVGPVMHLVQRWDESADKSVLMQDSYVRRATLAPITHIRHLERDGKTQIGGYRFVNGSVVGMSELAGNARKDFVMPMPEPSFNFEYDMELLQALPLAAGRTFDIPFYDAGVDPKPDRYRFVVAGDTRIASWTGAFVDCWLVTADYNTGEIRSRFWFAKKGQVLVREEAAQDDGTTLIKTLLPPESGDTPQPA